MSSSSSSSSPLPQRPFRGLEAALVNCQAFDYDVPRLLAMLDSFARMDRFERLRKLEDVLDREEYEDHLVHDVQMEALQQWVRNSLELQKEVHLHVSHQSIQYVPATLTPIEIANANTTPIPTPPPPFIAEATSTSSSTSAASSASPASSASSASPQAASSAVPSTAAVAVAAAGLSTSTVPAAFDVNPLLLRLLDAYDDVSMLGVMEDRVADLVKMIEGMSALQKRDRVEFKRFMYMMDLHRMADGKQGFDFDVLKQGINKWHTFDDIVTDIHNHLPSTWYTQMGIREPWYRQPIRQPTRTTTTAAAATPLQLPSANAITSTPSEGEREGEGEGEGEEEGEEEEPSNMQAKKKRKTRSSGRINSSSSSSSSSSSASGSGSSPSRISSAIRILSGMAPLLAAVESVNFDVTLLYEFLDACIVRLNAAGRHKMKRLIYGTSNCATFDFVGARRKVEALANLYVSLRKATEKLNGHQIQQLLTITAETTPKSTPPNGSNSIHPALSQSVTLLLLLRLLPAPPLPLPLPLPLPPPPAPLSLLL